MCVRELSVTLIIIKKLCINHFIFYHNNYLLFRINNVCYYLKINSNLNIL